MAKTQEGWLIAALDAISQFRATKEPLKNVVKRLIAQRRLGSRERVKMSDAVFAWSRLQGACENVIAELKKGGVSRPTHRQIDEAIINQWLAGDSIESQNFPAWFVAKLKSAYGEQTETLLESLHLRAGPSLAVDTRHFSIEDVVAALEAVGVSCVRWKHFPDAICITQGRFRIEALPKEMQERVWMMDPASQLVAQLALPPGSEKILDACAGAGGKTLFLLSRGARVTAMDISERRLEIAKNRCRGEKVHFVVSDALEPTLKPATFDYILLDSPCTGTGTLRRAPDLLLRLDEADLAKYVELQRKLIASLFKLLKPRGRLTYATCSILPEENAAQAAWATKELNLELVSERQLLPSQDDSDGFYVAVFQKTGE